jgi:hypothetical protein
MTDEPTFNNHLVDYWLRARLNSDDETRWEAIDAIRHICVPEVSIPLFLDTLSNDTYARARALAAHALYDLAVVSPKDSELIEKLPRLELAANDSSDSVRKEIEALLKLLRNADAVEGRPWRGNFRPSERPIKLPCPVEG